MTEEVGEVGEIVEDVVEKQEQETQEGSTSSSLEEKAASMGWKKDYDGDPDDFIDAKEFIRRKPLFDKIEGQKRELKEVQKALKLLQTHHENVKVVEYQRAIENLKEDKRLALIAGDADRLIEIDDQIADYKAEEKAAKRIAQQKPEVDPQFVAWVNENKWYANDGELRAVADEVGLAHSRSNPHKTPDEVLEYVVSRVKKLYPDKFRNPNKDRLSTVEGSSTTAPSRKAAAFELTEDERKAMNTFIRAGAMTKEQYIEDIKQMRGIK